LPLATTQMPRIMAKDKGKNWPSQEKEKEKDKSKEKKEIL
jgi:hypothetical protein